MKKIDSFSGEYAFLSNFYPSVIEWEGKTYSTVEHAYQASKTLDNDEREKIRLLEFPGQAKKAGAKLELRKNWDDIKYSIMDSLVYTKFKNNQELKKKLLDTENAELVEGNNWNDTFWGVCKGVGRNNLGIILMAARRWLRRYHP